VTGVGDVAGAILANVRLEGMLSVTPQLVRGDNLALQSDRLRGKVSLMIDLRTGRFDIVISGGMTRYLIPGLGIVDIKSDLRVVPGPGGKARVLGKAEAWVRRLDNSFFRELTGSLPRLTTELERTTDGGRKILISGGGRCNVLPSVLQPERFVTDSPPHLLRGMLRSWPLRAQRAFFEEDLGIPLALEEETGKLFPASNRARDVRDGLISLARARGVEVQSQTTVTSIEIRSIDTRPTTGTRLPCTAAVPALPRLRG